MTEATEDEVLVKAKLLAQGRRGGWVTRASRAAPDDGTDASFRTESQSFLHGARNCSKWPDKLLCVTHRRNSTTASARQSALLQTQPSMAYPCASVPVRRFLTCSNG
jgi:hypothetical protein